MRGLVSGDYQGSCCNCHLSSRFTPRASERDYLYLYEGSGCSSHVGRVGRQQRLSLGRGCLYSRGTATHELMHAAGFWHEQARADRDAYVDVHLDNVLPGYEFAFDK